VGLEERYWTKERYRTKETDLCDGWLCDWFERSGIGEIHNSLFFSLVR
jgi:hypothetical protein